jgi:phosphopantetheinyl transferase
VVFRNSGVCGAGYGSARGDTTLALQHPLLWAVVRMGTPTADTLAASLPHFSGDGRRQRSTDMVRNRRIFGRALALRLLAKAAPGSWTIEATDQGKPIAIGSPRRYVSISHSGNIVAAAVSAVGPIGIDVERHDPVRDLSGLAGAAFGPAEVAIVANEGIVSFYRIWTVREAIGKATGEGLAVAADRIDRVPHKMVDGEWTISQGNWLVAHDVVAKEFSLALAVYFSAACRGLPFESRLDDFRLRLGCDDADMQLPPR